MDNFKLEFNFDEFFELLDKTLGSEDTLKLLVNKFGGIHNILHNVIPEFKSLPITDKNKDYIRSLGEMIFSVFGGDSYKDDWGSYGTILKKLPVQYIIILLSNWCPKRHCDQLDDSVLSYLLNNYYEKELNEEIFKELEPLFNEEDLTPDGFRIFQLKEQFVVELLSFNNQSFLLENKTEVNFEQDEIKSLLCQIVIGNKLESIEKLETFCDLVRYFAPSNRFDRKYRDCFIMEIFESKGDYNTWWNEEEYKVWSENFYNIDFLESSSESIKYCIMDSVKKEADHISTMLKTNPNYRHD